MDEPTSAITDTEVEIADEVTVLRDGHFIGTNVIGELDSDRLISM